MVESYAWFPSKPPKRLEIPDGKWRTDPKTRSTHQLIALQLEITFWSSGYKLHAAARHIHQADLFLVSCVARTHDQRQAGWVLRSAFFGGKIVGKNLSKERVSGVVDFGALARKHTRERAIARLPTGRSLSNVEDMTQMLREGHTHGRVALGGLCGECEQPTASSSRTK